MNNEFVRYTISDSLRILPTGVRYEKYKDAYDAAVRFSEREGKSYYVIEVAFVCNAIAKVPDDKGTLDK